MSLVVITEMEANMISFFDIIAILGIIILPKQLFIPAQSPLASHLYMCVLMYMYMCMLIYMYMYMSMYMYIQTCTFHSC